MEPEISVTPHVLSQLQKQIFKTSKITNFTFFEDLVWKSKNREIRNIHTFDFFNCEITCDSTDIPVSIYDRQTAACRFDTIRNILGSLAQPTHAGTNVYELSGTEE